MSRCETADARTYLNDGRSSSNGIVSDTLVAASQDNICLASEALGNRNRETTLDGFGLDEGRASDSNERGVNLTAVRCDKSVVL
jgi:hypothetical protein